MDFFLKIGIGHTPAVLPVNTESRISCSIGGSLNWLKACNVDYDSAEILTDSLLIVNQINGKWNCNAEHLLPLRDEGSKLKKMVKAISLEWIPRERNRVADALTQVEHKKALRKYKGV